MKLILEFDLPEDDAEMMNAVNAPKMSSLIHNFNERMLKRYKYDEPLNDDAEAEYEAIHAMWCEMKWDALNDN